MFIKIRFTDDNEINCAVYPENVKAGDKPIQNKDAIHKLLGNKGNVVSIQNTYLQAQINTDFISSFEIVK